MKTANDAPFAIATDGSVFVNVTRFEGQVAPDILVTRALMEQGELFIGVRLSDDEVKQVLHAIAGAGSEASAYICGARMWAKGPKP